MVNVLEIQPSFWMRAGAATITDIEGTVQPLSTLYYASLDGVKWLDAQLEGIAIARGFEKTLKCWQPPKPQDMGPFVVNLAQTFVGPDALYENAGLLLARMKTLGNRWAEARLTAMLNVANTPTEE